MTRTVLPLAALLITAAHAFALDGSEVVAQAQARDGFSAWRDRRSVVTLENVEEGSGRTSEAEVFVRIQQWSDADVTTTLEGEETCGDGKTCYQLALVPAKGNDEFPYTRYRLWFDRNDLPLRRAQLYDRDDRLLRPSLSGLRPDALRLSV